MTKSFDRIADKFDETRSLPQETMSVVVDALEWAMPPGSSVLDAGVGTGRFALPLQHRGFEVVGADVSTRMMERAAAKGFRDLFKSDVCALPFKDQAFDYALSVHLIHLVPQWRCALGEIGRVTRGDLISVVTDRRNSATEEIRTAYRDSCRRLGFEVRHIAPGERELTELLPPDSKSKLAVRKEPLDVRRLLDNYESRTLSEHWDVPEDVHARAVGELRERYGGVDELAVVEDLFMLRWRADRLREFARSQG
ncbi:MAG: class I SAM-dependent methyltransferase [Thermoplasmata archaeon]